MILQDCIRAAATTAGIIAEIVRALGSNNLRHGLSTVSKTDTILW